MKKFFGVLFILFGMILILKMFVHTTPWDWFSSSGNPQVAAAPVAGVSAIKIDGNSANVHVFSGNQGRVKADLKKGAASVSGAHSIEINGESANVHVLPGNGSQLTADLKGGGHLTVRRKGANVIIKVDDSWFSWLPIGKKTSLDVYVPENYDQNMDFQLHWGNVHIDGGSKQPMTLNGLEFHMNAGNVYLRNMTVGALEDHGSAGNVQIHHVTADKAHFQLSAGNLNLNHFSGALDARLSAGNLEAQFDKMTGPIHVKNSAGNVMLDLPKQAGFSLDASVSQGKVACALPLKRANVNSDHHINGTYGSGTYPVDVTASVGNINVK